MRARLLLLCLRLRSSWLTVEGDRHVGAAGGLHRRDGRAAAGVWVGVAGGVPKGSLGRLGSGSALPLLGMRRSITPGRDSWISSWRRRGGGQATPSQREPAAQGVCYCATASASRHGVLGDRRRTEQGAHISGQHTHLIQDCRRGLPEHNAATVLLGLRITDIQHDRVDAGSGHPESRDDRRSILVRTDGRDLDALGAALGTAL